MSKRAVLCGILALSLSVAVYGREGFGFTKKAVDMTKALPPAINVSGTRVTVTVDTEHTRVSGKAEMLRQYTEAAVLASDKRLLAAPNGDVNVIVVLDRLDADQRSESKVEDNYQKRKTTPAFAERSAARTRSSMPRAERSIRATSIASTRGTTNTEASSRTTSCRINCCSGRRPKSPGASCQRRSK